MNTSNTTNQFTLRGLKRPSVITSETKQRVVFVRDASLSMDDDNKRIDASAATLDLLTELSLPENKNGFQVAVLDYSEYAKTIAPLTAASELEGTLPGIVTGGATNITAGLEAAKEILEQAPNPIEGKELFLKPVVILFTDGEHNSGNDPVEESKELKKSADIVTVAFGADADMGLLKEIANTPEHCYRCNEGRELRAFLAAVGETLSGSLQQGVNATQPLGAMTASSNSTSN